MSFSHILKDFYLQLDPPLDLPDRVEVLNPYQNPKTQKLVNQYFRKFYDDDQARTLLIGINPGRFGGGITGIGFTDPIHLQEKCGIENDLEKKHELSSLFMYQMIDEMGGAEVFFKHFLFSSVSPLGFVKDGKNLNYYDMPALRDDLEDFTVKSLQEQIKLGGNEEIAFSIGMGENIKYLKYLNKKHHLFGAVRALPHPRWIMQYRRKKKSKFIEKYIEELKVFIE